MGFLRPVIPAYLLTSPRTPPPWPCPPGGNQNAPGGNQNALSLGCAFAHHIARKPMKRDLYAEVSARIICELERGAAPWVKPWSATPGQNVPQNAVTSRPYSGCNVILLWLARDRGWATPRFLTFNRRWKPEA